MMMTMTNLLLCCAERSVLGAGLLGRLCDVELASARRLMSLYPVREIQLPSRGRELRWMEV